MLSRIALRNFKLHGNTEINAAPITVFIGPNNSGKSSIFQALLLLRQAATSGGASLGAATIRHHTSDAQPFLYNTEQLVDVGGFEQILKLGADRVSVGISGSFTAKWATYASPRPINVDFNATIIGGGLAHHRGQLQFEAPLPITSAGISWEWAGGSTIPSPAPVIQAPGITMQFQVLGDFRLIQPGGLSLSSPISDNELLVGIQDFHQHVGNAPRNMLRTVHPIFSLRGLEETGCPLTDVTPSSTEMMCLSDRTVALMSVLAYNPQLQDDLALWVQELLGIKIKVVLLPHKRVTLMSTPIQGNQLLFSNEGTGASQLPFILVPIGLTPPGETILLSEPEAHLYPQAQKELISLLLDLAKKEHRQFFIETHSEHVLHAILLAIATGRLQSQDVAFYSFKNANGTAEVTKLDVDAKGRVAGGLPGFFDQSISELSEFLEAMKKS